MKLKLTILYATREALGIIVMGAALFWPAGRLGWWQAWAALAVMLAWTLATAVIIFRFDPALLAERLGPRRGAKKWDARIVGALGPITFLRYIVAGLDQRYSWSGSFPLAAQIAALLVCAAGYALFTWATASNAFFSQVVRIQTDRAQTVVTGGPYRFLRHPAYLGAVLYEICVPILLGSWWALLVSTLSAGLLLVRTALEDRTLRLELAGYAGYARQVRYRLLPGVW
ncbi:MAG: isoprenylcysteine carboxylmethyltransferase family protein [Chloroflexi bacterium]|nr:isoprenylcysteine carboxylmethyltransferase family protein [Chloroflexota bacterium]